MLDEKAIARWQKVSTVLKKFPHARLLLVTKGQSPDLIANYVAMGQRHLGENYVQEALDKQPLLSDYSCIWHFIGTLQSNKLALIAAHFDWVETLIKVQHAKKLEQYAARNQRKLKISLQYQTQGREGVRGDALWDLARYVDQSSWLELKGLMVMPQAGLCAQDLRAVFSEASDVFKQMKSHFPASVDTLSMGMSGDYEMALVHGATEVRIGSALMGDRR